MKKIYVTCKNDGISLKEMFQWCANNCGERGFYNRLSDKFDERAGSSWDVLFHRLSNNSTDYIVIFENDGLASLFSFYFQNYISEHNDKN